MAEQFFISVQMAPLDMFWRVGYFGSDLFLLFIRRTMAWNDPMLCEQSLLGPAGVVPAPSGGRLHIVVCSALLLICGLVALPYTTPAWPHTRHNSPALSTTPTDAVPELPARTRSWWPKWLRFGSSGADTVPTELYAEEASRFMDGVHNMKVS